MTQDQYLTIVKCIQYGSPALSEELVSSLNAVITKCKAYEKEMTKSSQQETPQSETKKEGE